jgi:hypothetical protein
MKNVVFWDVTSCGSCPLRLLVTVKVVLNSPILVTLKTEEIHSSEMSVPTRVIRHNIPEDGILLSYYAGSFISSHSTFVSVKLKFCA